MIDQNLLRPWLKSMLSMVPVTITFTKKDGTERVMICTTNETLIPQPVISEDTETKAERKQNDNICCVS